MSTNNVAVLSYNICLEAMTHNVDGKRTHGSAYALGSKCTGPAHGLTVCAKNMAAAIDNMPATLGVGNFDLVGLQEASRADLLQAAAANTLNKLTSVRSKARRSEMASFYDGRKYTRKHTVKSQFSDHTGDRPFQILVLNETGTSEGIIFINCHCPHGSSDNENHPKRLQYRDFGAVSYDLGQALASLPLTSQEKGYRIVAVGDFNETGWNWGSQTVIPNTWVPLADAGIKTSISIDDSPFTNPPRDVRLRLHTCNQPDGEWLDRNGELKLASRGGDFIFDSVAPAPAVIPSNTKDFTSLCSDHLPAVALL